MEYRNSIVQVISEIIKTELDKSLSITFIQKRAKVLIPLKDINRFIEIVERELQSLHEGNIARYRINLSEYKKWHKNWK